MKIALITAGGVALVALGVVGVGRIVDTPKHWDAVEGVADLSIAMSNFAGEHGAQPLVTGGGEGHRFRAASDYPADWPEAVYLRRLFPDADLSDTGYRRGGELVPSSGPDLLTPDEALHLWVRGPRERDDRHPFRGCQPGRILDPWGTPYAVMTAAGGYLPCEVDGQRVEPYRKDGENASPLTHQVISAGPDRVFGPGGDWTPGEGPWAEGGPGHDDRASWRGMLPLGVRD